MYYCFHIPFSITSATISKSVCRSLRAFLSKLADSFLDADLISFMRVII